MLILNVNKGSIITIETSDGPITVMAMRVHRDANWKLVKLGIQAPAACNIRRKELENKPDPGNEKWRTGT